ncbi:DUF3164 family protein [Acetobacter pasteurianus]|uniref:DUF3164 family protein n=1 Tax=Acetobacter pasteurianus TaxID=438 RepID=UPI003D11C34E
MVSGDQPRSTAPAVPDDGIHRADLPLVKTWLHNRSSNTVRAYRTNVAEFGNVISFGPEIQAAQTLIHSCLNRWSEGANANLKAVVLDAFDVDKQGSMNVGKILALRRLEIDDEEWQRGMQAISDSVRVDVTKDYVRLHKRTSPDAKWELVTFDLSKLDVATT